MFARGLFHHGQALGTDTLVGGDAQEVDTALHAVEVQFVAVGVDVLNAADLLAEGIDDVEAADDAAGGDGGCRAGGVGVGVHAHGLGGVVDAEGVAAVAGVGDVHVDVVVGERRTIAVAPVLVDKLAVGVADPNTGDVGVVGRAPAVAIAVDQAQDVEAGLGNTEVDSVDACVRQLRDVLGILGRDVGAERVLGPYNRAIVLFDQLDTGLAGVGVDAEGGSERAFNGVDVEVGIVDGLGAAVDYDALAVGIGEALEADTLGAAAGLHGLAADADGVGVEVDDDFSHRGNADGVGHVGAVDGQHNAVDGLGGVVDHGGGEVVLQRAVAVLLHKHLGQARGGLGNDDLLGVEHVAVALGDEGDEVQVVDVADGKAVDGVGHHKGDGGVEEAALGGGNGYAEVAAHQVAQHVHVAVLGALDVVGVVVAVVALRADDVVLRDGDVEVVLGSGRVAGVVGLDVHRDGAGGIVYAALGGDVDNGVFVADGGSLGGPLAAILDVAAVHGAAGVAGDGVAPVVVHGVAGRSGVARSAGIVAGVDVDGPGMTLILLADGVGTGVAVGAVAATHSGELFEKHVALLHLGRNDGLGTHCQARQCRCEK